MAGREAACRKVLRLLEGRGGSGVGSLRGQAPGWSRPWPGWGGGVPSTLQDLQPMLPSPHREFEDIRNSSFHLDMW